MTERAVTFRENGDPERLIGAQLAIAACQRAGGPTERTTGRVEEILGRPPRSTRDFAGDLMDRLG